MYVTHALLTGEDNAPLVFKEGKLDIMAVHTVFVFGSQDTRCVRACVYVCACMCAANV